MLLIEDAFREIDHTLGTEGQEGVPRLELTNRAGALLYAEPWGWLDRKEWTLRIAAGREWINLPADCASLRTVESASGALCYVANYTAFVERKARGNASLTLLSPFYEEDGDGRRVAKLAVYPSPSVEIVATGAGRARWPDFTGEVGSRSVIPLPVAMPVFEGLFLELVRAVARGHQLVDQSSRQGELAAVYGGPAFFKARAEDARQFPRLGPMRNTAIDMARRARRPGMSDVIWSEPPEVDLGS